MTKTKFLILKRKLINKAKQLGVIVKFKKKKFKRNDFGVDGVFSCLKKEIIIITCGNNAYSLILAVLAHEVRHAEHFELKLFIDNYNPEFEKKDSISRIKKGHLKICPVELSQAAENDCNLFAINWLRENGVILDENKRTYSFLFKPYPIYRTLSYRLFAEIDSSYIKINYV